MDSLTVCWSANSKLKKKINKMFTSCKVLYKKMTIVDLFFCVINTSLKCSQSLKINYNLITLGKKCGITKPCRHCNRKECKKSKMCDWNKEGQCTGKIFILVKYSKLINGFPFSYEKWEGKGSKKESKLGQCQSQTPFSIAFLVQKDFGSIKNPGRKKLLVQK